MTKILITGANGQLGTELRQLLDERQGLFMLIPIDFDPKVKTKKRRNRIQSRINTLLYTNKENEVVAFTIPCCKKEKIRKELGNIGISKSFIYPDATYYADVKGGFELSFYGGLKMHDLGGLRINRC